MVRNGAIEFSKMAVSAFSMEHPSSNILKIIAVILKT
jgi:hypothetical protein